MLLDHVDALDDDPVLLGDHAQDAAALAALLARHDHHGVSLPHVRDRHRRSTPPRRPRWAPRPFLEEGAGPKGTPVVAMSPRSASDDLGRQRYDLRELLVPQFPRHGPEDAGADRVVVRLQQYHGVLVEADVGAVLAAHLLHRSHHDGPGHLALLDRPVGYRLLHGDDDHVSERRIPLVGAAHHPDALSLLGPGVVGNVEHGSRLDHGSPPRSLRRLLENLPDPPPLLLGQGPSLLDHHAVADLARVGLIMSLELLRPPHDPFVARVAVDALDQDHAGLGHLVAHHHALSRLLHVRYVLSSPNTGARAVATPVPRRILALACSFTPRLAAGYRLRPMFSSRSLRTVFARARSRRAWPTRAGFLATPIASWSLRLKSSSVRSLTFCSRSSVSISRHVVGFMPASERPRPRHELGLDADLLRGQPEPLARGGL